MAVTAATSTGVPQICYSVFSISTHEEKKDHISLLLIRMLQ